MKRHERKAWLKALKARQKEARRAKSPDPAPAAEPIPHESAPVVAEATQVLGQAREMLAAADKLDDALALSMLADAARLVHGIVVLTRDAIAKIPPAERLEALTIINERREPAEGKAQQRPRRGANPVVTLLKTAMASSSLLTRILARTNPEVGRRKKAA